MLSKQNTKRGVLAIGAMLLSLSAQGCAFTDPEPIAGSGGTSGAGGDPQGGSSGMAATGGESGFVGGSIGGGPSQGIDDGASGITGRAGGGGPSGASDR